MFPILKLVIPSQELWDEQNQVFIYTEEKVLELEHSLVSISKWEAKWEKAFLSREDKTTEETLDYVRCMTLTDDVDPVLYKLLPETTISEINKYIDARMTATTFFKEKKPSPNGEVVTSELIYYWMITLDIPFECEGWHLNRLLTLIKVCNIKNQPRKKMSQAELMRRNAALNATRKQQLNTNG